MRIEIPIEAVDPRGGLLLTGGSSTLMRMDEAGRESTVAVDPQPRHRWGESLPMQRASRSWSGW